MALLDPDTSAADPVLTPPAADPAPVADPAAPPADPMANAADKLFDDKPADPAPNTPPVDETPEQKAEREAKEREGETPEQKAERERKELDAKRYGAPEGDADYADFNLPEGVTLDDQGAADVKAFAKEMNLSQESAQKLVDIAAAKAQRDGEAATASLEAVHKGWVEQAKTDKEFGGDKLNASLATAQKALKEFGTPELNELVVGARLGDHPEFIRLLTRVGARLSEAPVVNGGRPTSGTPESVLYPNLKQ